MVDQIVEKFKSNPKYLTNGAGLLSKRWNCSIGDIYEAKRIIKGEPKEVKKGARILIFDLEISPKIAYTWGVRKQYIQPEQLIRDTTIMTFAAKWLGEDEIFTGTCKDSEDYDDFDVAESLWHLFEEADFIVAHNCERFDKNIANARFLTHGLPNNTPYKVIDTLKIAQQNFGTTWHKLDFLAKTIGSDGKMEHDGFGLWKKCMEGDNNAWDTMLKYNIKDIIELEKVYLTLRPWDSRHPSVSIFNEDPSLACTKCGSHKLEYVKDTYTNTRVFKLYKCSDCGGYSRSRKSENKLTALMTQ